MNDEERFENGMKMRRAVLGDAHVDRAMASADAFSLPMQEMVARHCWGDVWLRPGLGRKERSLINLAMIAALNRPHELKLHLRGALNNGVSKEEIREVFLQVAVYAGMPAGIDGFRVAREVFDEKGA
jgi:4-carboxymuconolactone decarboxylase